MKIFKELKKLGYIHYSATTIEELDDLPLNSAERISEQALVLRWFREKHKLHSSTFWMEIDKFIYWNYRYSYLNDKSTESVNRSMVYFNTPEEAELECLVKLIEIIKNK